MLGSQNGPFSKTKFWLTDGQTDDPCHSNTPQASWWRWGAKTIGRLEQCWSSFTQILSSSSPRNKLTFVHCTTRPKMQFLFGIEDLGSSATNWQACRRKSSSRNMSSSGWLCPCVPSLFTCKKREDWCSLQYEMLICVSYWKSGLYTHSLVCWQHPYIKSTNM